MIIKRHPTAVARRQPSWRAQAGIGAAFGLLAAMRLGAAELAVWLAAGGAALGVAWSFHRLPDAPRCRIPWWMFGCGGSDKVQDTDGNSRPKKPCWGHPDGRPKRLVNLVVLAGMYGMLGLLLFVAVAATRR